MKISLNPSKIQYMAKSFQKIEEKHRSSSQITSTNVSDNVSASSSNQNVGKLQSMQKDYIYSQQMFGALTQLAEALELFQRQPSTFEKNIKEIIEKIQKEFPQLSKYIRNMDDFHTLSDQVASAKNRLTTEMKQQKNNIVTKLVAEQNRMAIRGELDTSRSMGSIISELQSQHTKKIHTPRIDQITRLLS